MAPGRPAVGFGPKLPQVVVCRVCSGESALLRLHNRLWVELVLVSVVVLGAASARAEGTMAAQPTPAASEPVGTLSAARASWPVKLGARLFFDTRLSADGRVSCASCHVPEKAYADGLRLAKGSFGKTGVRNAPTLLNVAAQSQLFWDGRRSTLESQVLDPLLDPSEHGLKDTAQLLNLLRADARYRALFAKAYGSADVTLEGVTNAVAAFQRSLVGRNLVFDNPGAEWVVDRLPAPARRGFRLFTGTAGCAGCHTLSGTGSVPQFHAQGIGLHGITPRLRETVVRVSEAAEAKGVAEWFVAEPATAALGRFLVSRDPKDIGAFKVPSLRNVAVTAPYMHNGSLATLAEVIEHEINWASRSSTLVVLTQQEKDDLVAFLEALTDDNLADLAAWGRRLASED